MKLTVHTFLTLDGVMQGPGGQDEDPSGGFDHGGWLVPHVDVEFGRIVDGWFDQADEFLLGRSTYDMMQAYWTEVTDADNKVATALNGLPKHVVSHTLTEPTWQNTTVIAADVVAAVSALKDRPGRELQVHGSWQLARTLHDAGLVDEYRLLVFPVVVGKGKRLFAEGAASSAFTLVDSQVTSAGAVQPGPAARHVRNGRVHGRGRPRSRPAAGIARCPASYVGERRVRPRRSGRWPVGSTGPSAGSGLDGSRPATRPGRSRRRCRG